MNFTTNLKPLMILFLSLLLPLGIIAQEEDYYSDEATSDYSEADTATEAEETTPVTVADEVYTASSGSDFQMGFLGSMSNDTMPIEFGFSFWFVDTIGFDLSAGFKPKKAWARKDKLIPPNFSANVIYGTSPVEYYDAGFIEYDQKYALRLQFTIQPQIKIFNFNSGFVFVGLPIQYLPGYTNKNNETKQTNAWTITTNATATNDDYIANKETTTITNESKYKQQLRFGALIGTGFKIPKIDRLVLILSFGFKWSTKIEVAEQSTYTIKNINYTSVTDTVGIVNKNYTFTTKSKIDGTKNDYSHDNEKSDFDTSFNLKLVYYFL